jgi:hypothetical protein
MYTIVLETAQADKETHRYDDTPKPEIWEGIASAQGRHEEEAKAMMLDTVLEMLNSEELDVKNAWLRLLHFSDDLKTVSKVETF